MSGPRLRYLWVLGLAISTAAALGDGMVVPEIYYAKVEIPNQQALIHFSGGVERLVIETSFLGEGTNFAWVVPLPAEPEVKPVSEGFFRGLQQVFRPRLVHRVHPSYAGVLLVCGLAFLGWRSMKDDASRLADLPLCLLLAAGAGVLGGNVLVGMAAVPAVLCVRLFVRAPATYGLAMVVGTACAAALTIAHGSHGFGLVQSLGAEGGGDEAEAMAGVSVLSVQRAGVFDATTIRGTDPGAVLAWLGRNGYRTPKSAEPAIRRYVERGWVFVASKVRRSTGGAQLAALHPLAFTFAAREAVYPTALTAIENGDCSMDLYVFGNDRAAALHFSVVRCDRIASSAPPGKKSAWRDLRVYDPEILALIGSSTVGTKLSGKLSPTQMAADVAIKPGWFWRKGATVYSHSGAAVIGLNVAVPLATLAWLLMGASRGGWDVTDKWIRRWRWRLLGVAAGLGLAVFLWLPKVSVEQAGIEEAAVQTEQAQGWSQQVARVRWGAFAESA